MTLAGRRLGPYEVQSLLGAGGMGEVYRARDPRLGREVAIKVLPSERMADEGRRQRFVQEARAASALNHPNIVTIHEIESADGIDFIVMEHVTGKSLDALIPRQGMRLSEVLKTAIPIADALAQAHARGIVHRDLKPANVMVSGEGVVKVLDFGLAKLVSSEGSSDDEATATQNVVAPLLSRPGTVAGTAGYMSPEQATGGKVDARSDVFSFGAVLYEMVTGRRAFAGTTAAETMAAVVRDQPKPPAEVVPNLPRDLSRLIERCLRKEPERRFQMQDVKLELEQIKEDSASGANATARPVRGMRRNVAVGLLGLLALAALAFWRYRPREAALPPPRVVPVTSTSGWEYTPNLSPDGEQVAFSYGEPGRDGAHICLKIIASPEMRCLTTGNVADMFPNWSPDGHQIAFIRLAESSGLAGFGTAAVHLVSPLGGTARKLSDFPPAGQLSWSLDGRFIATGRAGSAKGLVAPEDGGIYLLPTDGGEPRRLTSAPSSGIDRDPAFSLDGTKLAYSSCTGWAGSNCDVYVQDLAPGLVPKGAPRRLTRQSRPTFGLAWERHGSSLVYCNIDGTFVTYLWRVAVDGQRAPERIEAAGLWARDPTTAPSRDRLVFVRSPYDLDIYRFNPGKAPAAVLTSSFYEGAAEFSPDGRRIAFESARSGTGEVSIWLASADGSNPVPLTPRGPGAAQGSPSWAPDGKTIAFDARDENWRSSLWTVDTDGGSPRRLTAGAEDERGPTWSRDGRFVYFLSTREGTSSIWRVPATGGAEERVATGEGRARESADQRSLLFMARTDRAPLLAQPLAGGPTRELLACARAWAEVGRSIFFVACDDDGNSLRVLDSTTGQIRTLGTLEDYGWNGLSVSPDGKTVLYLKGVGQPSDLMMIENFR